jgi:hypothetical protein
MNFTIQAYYRAEHGETPVIIRTADDVDALIDALLAESFSNSMAKLYVRERPSLIGDIPDHEFGVAVDAEDGVGGLWYLGDKKTWHSLGERGKRDEVFYCYVDNDRPFPVDSIVSIDLLRQATNEFLASGGERPTCVRWQPYYSPSID